MNTCSTIVENLGSGVLSCLIDVRVLPYHVGEACPPNPSGPNPQSSPWRGGFSVALPSCGVRGGSLLFGLTGMDHKVVGGEVVDYAEGGQLA